MNIEMIMMKVEEDGVPVNARKSREKRNKEYEIPIIR